MVGRLADRIGPAWVNLGSLPCAGLAFACAGLPGATAIWALVLAVNLLDFGLQSRQIANQTRIFTIGDTFRGRLNTVYMVGVFGGGAFGSLAGTVASEAAGWSGVCGLASALIGIAALVLILARSTCSLRP